jgi:hypothetical protein
MLEEVERTFLRRIGGLAALRELLDMISMTSRTTLWIASMNEAGFRYLRGAAGMAAIFTHRINAMAVTPEHLRAAVLQRHNLSGLRLQFAPPPEEDPRVGRMRRLLGLEREPQEIFFDSLYAQSEGVFRSAFELWQDSVERVEGGVVNMRQPLAPNYTDLEAELGLEDLLALQAILQHGSLTADELGAVLMLDPLAAHRCLGRLDDLEVLEPEPAGAGLRIRPQAGRFVRQVLHGRNLM